MTAAARKDCAFIEQGIVPHPPPILWLAKMSAPEPEGEPGAPAVEMTIVAAKEEVTHVAQKGVYEIDDHMLSREDVIERYKVGERNRFVLHIHSYAR